MATGSDTFCKDVRRLSTDFEQLMVGLSKQMRDVNDNIKDLSPDQITDLLDKYMKDENSLQELKRIADRKIGDLKDLRLKLLERSRANEDNMRQVQGRAGARDSGYASTDSQLLNRSARETPIEISQPSDAHPELFSLSSLSGPHALATSVSRISLGEMEHEDLSEA